MDGRVAVTPLARLPPTYDRHEDATESGDTASRVRTDSLRISPAAHGSIHAE
jgi:hypothetical protein